MGASMWSFIVLVYVPFVLCPLGPSVPVRVPSCNFVVPVFCLSGANRERTRTNPEGSESAGKSFAGVEHLDCERDGVYLVVVGGVGELADLFDKRIVPRAADEEDLSCFGAVCPGKRAGKFVDRGPDAADRLAGNLRIAHEVLDKRLAVQGKLDTVLGVALVLDAVDDVAALLGYSIRLRITSAMYTFPS